MNNLAGSSERRRGQDQSRLRRTSRDHDHSFQESGRLILFRVIRGSFLIIFIENYELF